MAGSNKKRPGQRKASATIENWKIKTNKAIELVIKASAQDIAHMMVKPVKEGGRMRVDTGFLRNSLVASNSAMPKINPDARPPDDAEKESFPNSDVSMAIFSANVTKPLYLGFTASYAAHREYGVRGAPPDGFVRMSAKAWPLIVDRNAKKLGVK